MEVILVILALVAFFLAIGIWDYRREAAKENRKLTAWQTLTGGTKYAFGRLLEGIIGNI